MADSIADLIARHPVPEGYTPVKSDLGVLIDRYGVGNIPLAELHRINTLTRDQMLALRAREAAQDRASAARTAESIRHEQMAIEWEASHGGR